jgi:hypothetical protein
MSGKETSNHPDLSSALDIRRIISLHAEASQHRDELLEEARELLAAGNVREAKRLMRTAAEIHSQLNALETQMSVSARQPR